MKRSVPAKSLILTIEANIDNEKLTDEAFREFVRTSLSICDEVVNARKNKLLEGERFIPI